ncbi:MAG: glycosyltransferase family 4 protein [Actinobacteria bacterium]|nr:glycosyltransferase family 4 protein [Actinomycetota bacterium]
MARGRRARICVLRQYHVPLDARVHREVTSLAEAGYAVDVICQRAAGEALREKSGSIEYWRLPVPRWRSNPLIQLVEYAVFFMAAAALVSILHIRRRYSVVQVNTVPDVLVFAAAVPRLLGARVVLDLHETMPEFFATKFGVALSHPGPRLAAALEQASIRFADAAITVTHPMREVFEARGAPVDEIKVILNGPDERIWDPDRFPPRRPDGEFHLISHGSLEDRYGVDTMIRAVALLAEELPGLRLKVYGKGTALERLRQLGAELGVSDRVWFSGGFVPLDDIVRAVAQADAGVVALKKDIFRDLTLAIKMYEYIAMRKPTLVARTRSVETYFDEQAFALFRSDDPSDLARAIREIAGDPERRARMVDEAARQGKDHRWPPNRERYLAVIGSCVGA